MEVKKKITRLVREAWSSIDVQVDLDCGDQHWKIRKVDSEWGGIDVGRRERWTWSGGINVGR